MKSALCLILAATCLRADGLAGRLVQDHSGAPIASADVTVARVGARELAAELETDGDGRFAAPTLPAGEYRIRVEKPGFAAVNLSTRVYAGNRTELALRLVRFASISGRVIDGTGAPVRGARVLPLIASRGTLRRMSFAFGLQSITDADGRYRLYNIPPGEYAIATAFGASSFAVGSTGQAPPPGTTGSGVLIYPSNTRPDLFRFNGGEERRGVDFVVSPGALFNVSGAVSLPDAKTRVWAALTPVDAPALAVAVATADDEGRFQMNGVPAGSYHLFVAGPVRGYGGSGSVLAEEPLFGRSRVDVAGADVSGVSVPLERPRSAKVKLMAAAGCPPAASVSLTSLEDWAAGLDRTIQLTAAQETVVGRLAPARYRLTLGEGSGCFQTGDAFLDVAAGASSATVSIAPAGSVKGRVEGDTSVSVVLLSDSSPAVEVSTLDAEGRFAFRDVPPGRYRVAARRASRWVEGEMSEVEVRGGAESEVVLRAPAAEVK